MPQQLNRLNARRLRLEPYCFVHAALPTPASRQSGCCYERRLVASAPRHGAQPWPWPSPEGRRRFCVSSAGARSRRTVEWGVLHHSVGHRRGGNDARARGDLDGGTAGGPCALEGREASGAWASSASSEARPSGGSARSPTFGCATRLDQAANLLRQRACPSSRYSALVTTCDS